MTTKQPLPPQLGKAFSVAQARTGGVQRSRLRSKDLDAPFHGVRALCDPIGDPPEDEDPSARRRREVRLQAQRYAPRMRDEEFFSHDTAALLLGAPLPLPRKKDDGPEPLHVAVYDGRPFPRSRGVAGHRLSASSTTLTLVDGLRVTTPASSWALLGKHSVEALVMAGDDFCRVWREGYGRPHVGRPPLTTRAKLSAALAAQRRVGAARLRQALALIREDSWSPRESVCRLVLTGGGLPEPSLNLDIHDERGFFVACADIVYSSFRVAVEYQGWQHGERYAKDIERIERLRAAGWIVIQVTSELLADRDRLISRVREALLSRGWRP